MLHPLARLPYADSFFTIADALRLAETSRRTQMERANLWMPPQNYWEHVLAHLEAQLDRFTDLAEAEANIDERQGSGPPINEEIRGVVQRYLQGPEL